MSVEGSKAEVVYDDGDVEVKFIGDHMRITKTDKVLLVSEYLEIPTATFKKICRKWNHFQRKDK